MSDRLFTAALRRGPLRAFAAILSLATAACAPAPGSGTESPATSTTSGADQRFTGREAIEHVLSRANIGRTDIKTIITDRIERAKSTC